MNDRKGNLGPRIYLRSSIWCRAAIFDFLALSLRLTFLKLALRCGSGVFSTKLHERSRASALCSRHSTVHPVPSLACYHHVMSDRASEVLAEGLLPGESRTYDARSKRSPSLYPPSSCARAMLERTEGPKPIIPHSVRRESTRKVSQRNIRPRKPCAVQVRTFPSLYHRPLTFDD